MSQSPNTDIVDFYTTTGDVWDAMYQDCLTAEHSIDFEQYIIEDDNLGQLFLKLFADKAQQGVSVNLKLDRVGCRNIHGSESIANIRKHGGQVDFYNSLHLGDLFKPGKWFPRNHAKTLIIDSRILYIGSACLAESMRDWRDTQMKLAGPIVANIQAQYDAVWFRKPKRKPNVMAIATSTAFRYIASAPRLKRNPIYKELLENIRRAEKDILIVTPYFLPPLRLRLALRNAIRRGVNVHVMFGEKTDVRIADMVSRSYIPKLVKYGMCLYLYQANVLHAKYIVIDSKWATIGSTNMDYLSLLLNREANIITTSTEVIDQLKMHFNSDLEKCMKADLEYWRQLPMLIRIIARLGRMVRGIL